MKSYNIAAAALAILSAGLFVVASQDTTIPQFWVTLGFVSMVSSVLAWLTSRSFDNGRTPLSLSSFIPRDPAKPYDLQRRRLVLGISFAVSASLAITIAFAWHWKPQADFDIIGILWLMENGAPLLVVAVLVLVAIATFIYWLETFKKS